MILGRYVVFEGCTKAWILMEGPDQKLSLISIKQFKYNSPFLSHYNLVPLLERFGLRLIFSSSSDSTHVALDCFSDLKQLYTVVTYSSQLECAKSVDVYYLTSPYCSSTCRIEILKAMKHRIIVQWVFEVFWVWLHGRFFSLKAEEHELNVKTFLMRQERRKMSCCHKDTWLFYNSLN